MAAGRGAFPALLAPGLAMVFFRQLKARTNEHTKWMTTKTSKRAYEDEHQVIGLGQMVPKPEGTVYTMDDPIDGGDVRYTHVTYGLGVRITEEMMEDDLYGVMNRMMQELAQSASYQWDTIATDVLNNAFNATYAGYDTKALCATDHPVQGGADQANRPAVDTDLTLPALQAGIEAFEGWKQHRGLVTDRQPKKLFHNVGDIFTAGEILESEFEPTSANNAVNIVRSRYGIVPILLKRLTDVDQWGLLGNDHDMKMYKRRGTQMRETHDPFNGDKIMTARQRNSSGHSNWHDVYSSPGT